MSRLLPVVFSLLSLAGLTHEAQAADVRHPPANARYVAEDGSIAIIGNDGMESVMTQLNTLFSKTYPGFRFTLTAKGSSVGMPALSAGATAIAPLSRELWLEDAQAFRQIKGYAPLDIRIGYSGWGPRAPHNTAPAVYVHESNPLQSLSMLELKRLATAGSMEGDINTWGQLGLGNDWTARRIHLYGLRDDGGFATNQRMDKFAGQPWSFKYEALQSREAVIAAVANDPYGVGLTGWVNARAISDKVRIMPLRATAQAPAALPDYNDVAAGNYPLSAYLHLYVDAAPGHKLEPFIIAYLEMALSEQGQAIIRAQKDSDEGYVPLSPEDLTAERAKLQSLKRR